jgi:ATP-binding cassette subfamily B protein
MTGTARSAVRGLGSAYRLAWQASRWALSGFLAVAVVSALVPVAQVWLLKELLDRAAAGNGGMLVSGIGLIAAGLASTLLPPASQYLHNQVGRQTGRQALADLYCATGRLAGLARLEDPDFRDRLRLAQQAGRSGPVQTVNGGLAVLQSCITVVGLVVVLAAISPLAAAVVVGAGLPRLVAELRLSRARAVALWQLSPIERREIFYAELQTSLPAAKEMRLLGLAGFFRERMLLELGEADRQRRALDRRELRMQLGLGLLSALVSAAGLAWAIVAMSNGQLSVGDLSAFVAAIAGVLVGVGTLVGQLAFVTEALLNYEHYRTILAAEPDLPEPAGAPTVPPLSHEIRLTDVWFRYGPDLPWVLRGVDLSIRVGESVALVGLNGAGKSTLVKLLCRFYDPERGSISWDGTDLRELSVASLRERIGAVFQDYMEYDLSVAENIGVGDLPRLQDGGRIRAAAERADLDGTVAALPRSYQTLLSRMFPDPEADGLETASCCPAASGSGSHWPGRSCGTAGTCSSWTSRARASTPPRSTRSTTAYAGIGPAAPAS